MTEIENLDLLLVDDEVDMLRGLGRILRSEGYRVDMAHSGEEALEKLKNTNPKGVLMDIRMPGMSGIETSRHIRTARPSVAVPTRDSPKRPAATGLSKSLPSHWSPKNC